MSTILVVDDESAVRELYARALVAGGWLTTGVRTAEEALDFLALMPDIPVVIADLEMPGKGGAWLVEQMRDRYPGVAVILATANESVPGTLSLQAAVVRYLVKPFSADQLREAVSAALSWQRRQSTSTGNAAAGSDPIEQWLDKKLTHNSGESGPPAGPLRDENGVVRGAVAKSHDVSATDLKVFAGGQSDDTSAANVAGVLDSAVRFGWNHVRPRAARILVVDDEDMIRVILRRVLKAHEVIALSSAKEALALLAGGATFDAIICDLMMPAMNGIEFYQILVQQYPDQASAVMFVTGGAFSREAAAFLDSVPNMQLAKPFDAVKLRASVDAHLQARRAAGRLPGSA